MPTLPKVTNTMIGGTVLPVAQPPAEASVDELPPPLRVEILALAEKHGADDATIRRVTAAGIDMLAESGHFLYARTRR